MAKYRTAVILPLTSLGTSGTKVVDLNVKDPISALRFEGIFTNGSSGAQLVPVPQMISKLELIDGSDVLFSLDGTQMAAVHFYEGHPFIYIDGSAVDSDTINFNLQYNFGRYPHDPLLAFDPTRFRNPQLKITWNVATANAAATAFSLEISAELFDEKAISPLGFLRTTQFHSYSPGASTYEYIDLPTDLVIRKLFLQTREYGSAATSLLTDVKLSEDNDKRIPFLMTDTNWCNYCAEKWGMLLQNLWGYGGSASDPVFVAPCKYETGVFSNVSGAREVVIQGSTGGKWTLTSSTAGDIVHGIMMGFLPYFHYCYSFGDDNDPEDWYDLKDVGSLRLAIQSGSASVGAVNNTLLQQLRRY